MPISPNAIFEKSAAHAQSAIALCTYCSRIKDRSSGPLRAIERYASARIRRVATVAEQTGARFLILSRHFGLLEASDPVPRYDHLLEPGDVDLLAPTVASQLNAKCVTSLRCFTHSLDQAALLPYFNVIRIATRLSGVGLETVRLDQEGQPMSDWRTIMSKAEQAKRVMTSDRQRGAQEFDSLLREFPGDGMVYLKRGEGLEALGQAIAARADFERAAGLFPMERWRSIAREAAGRCAQRAAEEGSDSSPEPVASVDALAKLPSPLREAWRDALDGGPMLPTARVTSFRVAAERSVEFLLEHTRIDFDPRTGLDAGIRLLRDREIVDAVLASHLHTIRKFGNQAAHGGKVGEDEVDACSVAAGAILKALRAIGC